eukprot:TRINITY_DN353_c0_g1_i1.p2 TRINITY_DN353_c0_g1~~TRINITY_DN353_c0_g1_i1.p2  ORF type:complete len:128 (-),score=21.33 TRINITY_DN353_c0_g1_i1:18-401(-)
MKASWSPLSSGFKPKINMGSVSHTSPGAGDNDTEISNSKKRKSTCHFMSTKKWCKFGTNCRFSHDGDVDSPSSHQESSPAYSSSQHGATAKRVHGEKNDGSKNNNNVTQVWLSELLTELKSKPKELA